MARPSIYTDEIAKEIVERLSNGEPLEEICRDEKMPSSRAVNDWINNKVASVPLSITADIARARDIGFDVIAARTRDVARGFEGSSGDVARDRLIIETDLKLLAKWNPKKYGEKQQVEHSGNLSLSALIDKSYKKLENTTEPLTIEGTKYEEITDNTDT